VTTSDVSGSILLATPRIPNRIPKTGGQSVLLGILNYYSRYYEIDIITRYNPKERNEIDWLNTKCSNGIFIKKYTSSNRIGSIIQKVSSWILYYQNIRRSVLNNKYKFVQLEWIESGFFCFIPKNTKVITDTHDVRYKLLERKCEESVKIGSKIIYTILAKLFFWLEHRTLRRSNLILTKSNYDRNEFLRVNNKYKIDILTCQLKVSLITRHWTLESSKNNILFLGHLERDENNRAILYFCQQIWPGFSSKYPNFHLKIVGKNPSQELQNIVQNEKNINLTGYVDNILDEFSCARIFVAPLTIGGGIIIKILDALTFGIPTITSSYGNQGIHAENGKHLLIADSKNEFLEKMNLLVNDNNYCKQLSINARQFVIERFDFSQEMDRIRAFLQKGNE